jgi:PKD repeat protein
MRRFVRFSSRIRRGGARRHGGSRGQSLTELALILPVFILIVLLGLDLGRAFLGWVGLQQAARIAANFASSNATAWNTPGNAQVRNRYKDLILNEAQDVDWDCDLPSRGQLPDPTFPAGKGIGSPAKVTLTCAFHLATPIIGAFFTNPLMLGSSASFPIRNGPLAGQAAAPGNVPNSAFTFSPNPAPSGVPVQFLDQSSNNPTGWLWTFSDDGSTSTAQFPSHTFACASGTCQYSVSLTASNINGADATPATQTVPVQSAHQAPIAQFTWQPPGTNFAANTVITFTDTSLNPPYSWTWNFGDGTPTASGGAAPASSSHRFQCALGSCPYTVTLTITNGVDPASSHQTVPPLTFATDYCTVPTFVGHLVQTQAQLDDIQLQWHNAGFHDANGNPTFVTYTNSQLLPTGSPPKGSGNKTYHVTSQSYSNTQPCTQLVNLTWALS